MNSILFGNGYWGNIVKEKIIGLTNLTIVQRITKTDILIPDNMDIAFVCCSTSSHYEVIKRCLDKGIKYLFCTKPFTGDYDKAKELFDIAKNKNINIFVDNLFLFRKEIMNIQIKEIDCISFNWNKLSVRENLIDSLLYHDLYLLLKWSQSDEWKINYGGVYDNSLHLSLFNGYQNSFFRYDIGKENKKWIVINDQVIDLTFPKHDPLKECIVNMFKNNIDYNLSREVTLNTLKLMNSIQKKLALC